MVGSSESATCLELGSVDWQCLATCPTGATHRDRGVICQDAVIASHRYFRGQPLSILAVADGHGGERYTRSDFGAHFALDIATEIFSELGCVILVSATGEVSESDPSKTLSYELEHRIARKFESDWKRRVVAHAEGHPEDGVDPHSAAGIARYGSTIVVLFICGGITVAGCLGDSALYAVYPPKMPNGAPEAQRILPSPDIARVGVTTDSLCSIDAAKAWTWLIIDNETNPIAMLMLATDGFGDSLEDPLHSVLSMFERTCERGLDWLREILPQQLGRWSAEGVGDDMGCLVAFRRDLLEAAVLRPGSPTDV